MANFRVYNRVTLDCIRDAKAYMGVYAFETMCKEYAFIDYLCKLDKFPVQSPTLHWLLSKGEVDESQGPNKRTLNFTIDGQVHTFGHLEFAIVTGLPFGEYPPINEEEDCPFTKFLGTSRLLVSQLVLKIVDQANINREGNDIRKLAVIYIIHSMVFFKDQNYYVNPKLIRLVDDPELFNSYPWGRMVYDGLTREWSSMLKKIKEPGFSHLKVATFPFALQAWVLECLQPELASLLARRLPGNPLPRILRWDTTHAHSSKYTEAKQNIFQCETLNFMRLTPEHEELEADHYRSVRAYIEYNPTLLITGAEVDEEKVPLNLMVALKKLDNKVTAGFKRLEDRLAYCEGRINNLQQQTLDAKKIELIVSTRMHEMFSYQFDMAMYRMEKKLREELNLPPSGKEPPVVHEILSDVKSSDVVKDGGPDGADGAEQQGADISADISAVEVDDKPQVTEAGRPQRVKRAAPTQKSPYYHETKKRTKKTKVDKKVKVKNELEKTTVPPSGEDDGSFQDPAHPHVPHPYHPTNISKAIERSELIREWVAKNASKADTAGLVTCVRILECISCKNLETLISGRGWLTNEHIDAHLQLLNVQAGTYPEMFNSTKWTCMGSLYSRNVKYACKLFVENRQMNAEQGKTVDSFAWANLDIDMCKVVQGVSDNWSNKAWMYCDQIYGVENIAESHWAAYAYDFQAKEVRVYDSMLNAYTDQRRDIFYMHAAIAPSLYNETLNENDDKLDIEIPFAVKYVDVPQQPNSSDCGVYAIKFIQCMAMNADFGGLDPANFVDYRMKLAVDLIKWSKMGGQWMYEEKDIVK